MPDAPATSENSDVRIKPPEVDPEPQRQQTFEPLPPPSGLRGRKDEFVDDRPVEEVLEALAADKPISEGESRSATDWFLSEDPTEEGDSTHTIELNVGVGEKQDWISWVVRPIDSDELRRIQRQTQALRRRGKQDDIAVDLLGNLKTVIAGSVDPDIEAIAQEQRVAPEGLLQRRFRSKPGLIAQLASQIMSLSGFDDEDVRDALSAKN